MKRLNWLDVSMGIGFIAAVSLLDLNKEVIKGIITGLVFGYYAGRVIYERFK